MFNLYVGVCPSAPPCLGTRWVRGGGRGTWRRLSSTGWYPSPWQISQTTSFFFLFLKILGHLVLSPRAGAHPSLPSAQERCGAVGVSCGVCNEALSSLAQAASGAWGRLCVRGDLGSFGVFRLCLGHIPPPGADPQLPAVFLAALALGSHLPRSLPSPPRPELLSPPWPGASTGSRGLLGSF